MKSKKYIFKFLNISASCNLFLAALKFVGGFFGNSEALISDAIHSLADVLSSFIVLLGVYLAERRTDISHEYGHERMECVASLILSIFLFFTGISIGKTALSSIISGLYKNYDTPNTLALSVAIISIIIKESMFWITMYIHKKSGLISLKADAWHQRTDALSSVGSLFGVSAAMIGYPIGDVLASLIICLFILKISINIFIEACNRMVDKSCDQKLENMIKAAILMYEGICAIDEFKSRLFGAKIIIEVKIVLKNSMSLCEACLLADTIEQEIKTKFDIIKKCSVILKASQ